VTVITFSREAHSGTRDLARLLADRLGYRYVSRDEITAAAHARSGLDRTPQTPESEGRALSFVEQLGEQLSGDRAAYRAALESVVTEFAMDDDVVIVGYGAGLFLRDLRSLVRVFVVAPFEDRVARVIAEGEPDAERARREVEQQDRESAAFLRYLFGIDWLEPHNWDIVINVGRTDVTAAIEMLATYAQTLGRTQAEQDELSRRELINRLEQTLLAVPDLGLDKLRISIASGTVVLEGHALFQEDRERAEALARSTAPEAVLDNRIVVRPPSSA
jgi:cytidylate kinase